MFTGSPELVQAIMDDRMREAEEHRMSKLLRETVPDERALVRLKKALARGVDARKGIGSRRPAHS